jgi:carboxypeptidase C (cathepsin A)
MAAVTFCDEELGQPFWASGLNPYDVSKVCDGPMEETRCYPLMGYISKYLNKSETRKTLGVSPKVENFKSCSAAVGADFVSHLDGMRMTTPYVEGLLERGIQVLIYVGTYDLGW